MPTKEKLSEELNEELGTDIEWDKMKKDDIKEFKQMCESGLIIEPILKNMAKEKGSEVVDQKVEEWRPGKYVARLL